jgi:hypothetical protein
MTVSPTLTRNLFVALAAVLVLVLLPLGCSAGGGGQIPDAHAVDAYEVSLDLPAGCPPDGGNEKGVGRPCTRGGNECNNAGNLRCTCDVFQGILLEGVPCICTLVTLGSGDPDAGNLCDNLASNFCGTNASCCAYMTLGTYCVPNICLPGNECPVVVAPPP